MYCNHLPLRIQISLPPKYPWIPRVCRTIPLPAVSGLEKLLPRHPGGAGLLVICAVPWVCTMAIHGKPTVALGSSWLMTKIPWKKQENACPHSGVQKDVQMSDSFWEAKPWTGYHNRTTTIKSLKKRTWGPVHQQNWHGIVAAQRLYQNRWTVKAPQGWMCNYICYYNVLQYTYIYIYIYMSYILVLNTFILIYIYI